MISLHFFSLLKYNSYFMDKVLFCGILSYFADKTMFMQTVPVIDHTIMYWYLILNLFLCVPRQDHTSLASLQIWYYIMAFPTWWIDTYWFSHSPKIVKIILAKYKNIYLNKSFLSDVASPYELFWQAYFRVMSYMYTWKI